MFTLVKTLWTRLTGQPFPHELYPTSEGQPDEEPLPHCEPQEPRTHYVLPLRWSLYYALTEKQWRQLRERHKELCCDWGRCSCPKRCTANTLDEKWRYDAGTHTKIFLGAAFICRGCHWLKTPPWRIQTWLEQQKGVLPALCTPPHVIGCLGWTQRQVDALRARDLKKHRAQTMFFARLDQQVQQGRAAIVPAPRERLSALELEKLVRPGQVMVVPWRVDLSALTRYGYSQSEIVGFEQRMYTLAANRMSSLAR
jgi:hypothetical protein